MEVSRGGLAKDQLLERQIRDRLAQPLVLLLKILQPLHLVALQAAEFLAPAVIGERRDADRADRFGDRASLRYQHVDLPQLRDDLFGLMSLLGHSIVLQTARKPYFREDHFLGGRPGRTRKSPRVLGEGLGSES